MTENKLMAFYQRRPDLINIIGLTIIVATIFCVRLGDRPLIGEETRYGTAAREMIETGDVLVFRQQGQVFAERPPLTIWTVAVSGWLRGEVDEIAVRLTSIISVILTSLLLYFYVRSFASGVAAFTAGLIYPTMGQVLQIGRLGESEPLFALLLSASLLLWHMGYLKNWRPVLTWSVGCGCAGLAALAKGPQAPVYFFSIIGVYLIVQRDWRYLFSRATLVGGMIFVSIVAAWQIPYLLATDWESTVATWTGLAKDRIRMDGLGEHMLKFPLETFVCLLPWSPLLLAFVFKSVRKSVSDLSPAVTFLVVALMVSYPSVWFAVGARGRYFLPLYPCFAALIAIVVERCSTAQRGTNTRLSWQRFQVGIGMLAGITAIAFAAIGISPGSWAESMHQPRWFAIVFSILSAFTWYVCIRSAKSDSQSWNVANIVTISLFSAVIYVGILVNTNVERWNDPTASITELKTHAQADIPLVSLGPIDHRFAYYYEDMVEQVVWPTAETPLADDVEYFVFMRRPTDTPEKRTAGRGRSWYHTPGTVPFEWEEIMAINCNRVVREEPQAMVVLGRVVRPLRVAVSDVTRPKPTSTASAETLRR